jgi:hypothetical protein
MGKRQSPAGSGLNVVGQSDGRKPGLGNLLFKRFASLHPQRSLLPGCRPGEGETGLRSGLSVRAGTDEPERRKIMRRGYVEFFVPGYGGATFVVESGYESYFQASCVAGMLLGHSSEPRDDIADYIVERVENDEMEEFSLISFERTERGGVQRYVDHTPVFE